MLKKVADDPSSRAWMSTIKAASIRKEQLLARQVHLHRCTCAFQSGICNILIAIKALGGADSDGLDEFTSWNTDPLDNFLVCIYNVSPDQPYAILKASVTSTATDIIQRVSALMCIKG